jgi:hypothetical protein
MPDAKHGSWLPHLPNRVSLVHKVVLADVHASEVRPTTAEVKTPGERIVSDTGQLTWEDTPGDGRVIVDAPCHQAIIMRSGVRATSNMVLSLHSPFAAVQLASLDGSPIAGAGKLLLVAVGRVANTGMEWLDETRTSVFGHVGGAPTRIEPVLGRVALRGLAGARSVNVQALDGQGQAWGEPRAASATADGFTFDLTADPGTTWYRVLVER